MKKMFHSNWSSYQDIKNTVFFLISTHALISVPPPEIPGKNIGISIFIHYFIHKRHVPVQRFLMPRALSRMNMVYTVSEKLARQVHVLWDGMTDKANAQLWMCPWHAEA